MIQLLKHTRLGEGPEAVDACQVYGAGGDYSVVDGPYSHIPVDPRDEACADDLEGVLVTTEI